MFNSLDISTSALVAQRTRLDTISGNIANISTLVDEDGQAKPYQARFTLFQAEPLGNRPGATGVKVSGIELDQAEPVYRYQPEHPLAIESGEWKGYVAYPNINLTEQFVDALTATRSYEANIGVIEVSKNMSRQTLSIIA
jgi:flagellar basal-body rod protein FlgC